MLLKLELRILGDTPHQLHQILILATTLLGNSLETPVYGFLTILWVFTESECDDKPYIQTEELLESSVEPLGEG